MLNGKLRIAPTCYHVLHLIPVLSADEMGFFYDEGLKSADGSPAYKVLRQAMKKQSVDIALDVRSRTVFAQRARRRPLYHLGLAQPAINNRCAEDSVAQAYQERLERQEQQEELQRVAAIAQKWGY